MEKIEEQISDVRYQERQGQDSLQHAAGSGQEKIDIRYQKRKVKTKDKCNRQEKIEEQLAVGSF